MHTEHQDHNLQPDLHKKSEKEVSESVHAKNPLKLSAYTTALIKAWEECYEKIPISTTRISVSQTVSFLAFLYEKMRNAVEFREEHLIRRAAIERIIKRRMLLNENGRDIAEVLIKELLWARYYENNTLGEEKIADVQTIIDKYFFIRNEISAGRSTHEQENIANFILEVLAAEIEENLSSNLRLEAFTNFVYQLIRPYIAPFNGDTLSRDIQVYIAVEKTFAHSDEPLIRYHLLKLMIPEITTLNWKSADKILSKIYEAYYDIEKYLKSPTFDKIRNYIKKQIPPFLVLQDVFNQNKNSISEILSSDDELKNKVDMSCRKRYEETKDRLRRMGVRAFIYIILTKVIFAFLLEVPYDLYFLEKISYFPIIINVLFPPILMSGILLSVSVPGDENTRRIFNLIKGFITQNPQDPSITKNAVRFDKKPKAKGAIFALLFTLFYLFTYLLSFGSIIYILTRLNFNPISQGIFIFFVALVTFFAFRVISITQEYLVVEKESPLTPLFDLFFLPIIRLGQWLSGEILTKFNVLIFVFDFIIEMPLKAIVEVIDEWIKFVKIKKEEII